jgi:hypothetical protein
MAPAPVPGFASRKASEHAVEASAAPVAEAAPPVESPWKWSFGIGTNEPEDARELACLSENPVRRLNEDVESFERNLPTQCYGVYGYTPPYYSPPYYSPPYRFSMFLCYVYVVWY